MPKKENSKKEIRFSGEIRAAQNDAEPEKHIVVGQPIVFEQPTVLFTDESGVEYKEVVDKNALTTTDLSDVAFKYNHSDDVMVMARTRNKTLTLKVDGQGLSAEALLANTSSGNDMYELIKRGDIDKMSYAYVVAEDSYDHETHTRRILNIKKLYDVSAVDFPAYDQTSISARDYFSSKTEEEKHISDEKNKEIMNLRKLKVSLAEKSIQ